MAKVLIVEQDAHTSALVANLLHARGHRIRMESNGAAALLAAHEDLPDVLIIDLALPILEGLETLQALRHDAHTAHIPVIVLSGRNDDQMLAGALTTGANVYCAQPLDLTGLLAAVERLATLRVQDHATS